MNTPKTETPSKLELRLTKLNQYKIDLGLARLNKVIDRLELNNPAPQIITVGGTNGKGSTVTALCSMLAVKKKSFGAFTSPHIFSFNERININGEDASDTEILSAFDVIDSASTDLDLSYFEYAFLAALLVFVAHQVEVVVLEVGLGGRLDATNAVSADVAIITTVDIDHIEWLGDDIESIAAEKAGIMRSGKPVVYGDFKVPQSITSHAEQLNASLHLLGSDYEVVVGKGHWSYINHAQAFTKLQKPALQGDWQIYNFSSALTALLSLGYAFSENELLQSLSVWNIPGRLQTMQNAPLVLADVAHNRQSAIALQQWLHANPITGRTYAVFSVLADKQVGSWLGALADIIDHWMIFELRSQRAMELSDLKKCMADHVSLFSCFESGHEAYQMTLLTAMPDDRIVVFGSFHVLEEVFK